MNLLKEINITITHFEGDIDTFLMHSTGLMADWAT